MAVRIYFLFMLLLLLLTDVNTSSNEDFSTYPKSIIEMEKPLERNTRSGTEDVIGSPLNCSQYPSNISKTWNPFTDGVEMYTCPCNQLYTEEITNTLWFYEDEVCREISELDGKSEISLSIIQQYMSMSTNASINVGTFYCKTTTSDHINCQSMISINNNDIVEKGVPHGVGKFLTFLLISSLILALLCIVKRFKLNIHLCIRDTCKKSDDSEKVYDAYISIAGGDTERKYIERNFAGVLQNNHNYRFYIDEENLLEQLEYSNRLNDTIHLCNRLIIVLTPAYMNNDWCMYCFAEGFRKLVQLQIPMLVVVSDHVVREEIREANSIISTIETIMMPFVQTDAEKEKNLLRIRQFLAAPVGKGGAPGGGGYGGTPGYGDSRQPILKHVEDIDRRSRIIMETDGDFTDGNHDTRQSNLKENDDEMELEYIDEMSEPDEVKVKEYKTQKNFYSLTGEAGSL